jgi:hypothetical protein
MKATFQFLFSLLFVLIVSAAVGQTFTQQIAIAGVLLMLGALVRVPKGVAAAISVSIWEDFIAKNLWKGYDWLRNSKNRDGNVLLGKVVYIPQAGATPTVVKNRTVFPISVTQRDDTSITYEIDEFSTDAIHIPEADKIELTYNKIADVMDDHMKALNETVAKWAIYTWNATVSGYIVASTGASQTSYLSGTTGNRKKFLVADLQSAKTKLNNATKRESGNRWAVMSEDAYNDILGDSNLTSMDNHKKLGAVFNDNGDLVKLAGFNIARVPNDVSTRYTTAGVPIAPGGTVPATAEDSILCYDADFVHLALGSIKFYGNLDDATYQGDVYSAQVRAGYRKEYSGGAGVVTIQQETP